MDLPDGLALEQPLIDGLVDALGNSDRLGWHVLARVDRLTAAGEHETQEANYVGIADQPEPTISLSPRVGAEVAER